MRTVEGKKKKKIAGRSLPASDLIPAKSWGGQGKTPEPVRNRWPRGPGFASGGNRPFCLRGTIREVQSTLAKTTNGTWERSTGRAGKKKHFSGIFKRGAPRAGRDDLPGGQFWVSAEKNPSDLIRAQASDQGVRVHQALKKRRLLRGSSLVTISQKPNLPQVSYSTLRNPGPIVFFPYEVLPGARPGKGEKADSRPRTAKSPPSGFMAEKLLFSRLAISLGILFGVTDIISRSGPPARNSRKHFFLWAELWAFHAPPKGRNIGRKQRQGLTPEGQFRPRRVIAIYAAHLPVGVFSPASNPALRSSTFALANVAFSKNGPDLRGEKIVWAKFHSSFPRISPREFLLRFPREISGSFACELESRKEKEKQPGGRLSLPAVPRFPSFSKEVWGHKFGAGHRMDGFF